MAAPAKQHYEKFRADVTKRLHEPNKFNDALGQVENKTGLDRFFVVLGEKFIYAMRAVFVLVFTYHIIQNKCYILQKLLYCPETDVTWLNIT